MTKLKYSTVSDLMSKIQREKFVFCDKEAKTRAYPYKGDEVVYIKNGVSVVKKVTDLCEFYI